MHMEIAREIAVVKPTAVRKWQKRVLLLRETWARVRSFGALQSHIGRDFCRTNSYPEASISPMSGVQRLFVSQRFYYTV